ncbi:hypothetical protein [Bradyrhizobium japonicum]|uniref:hypothetical protein n=1 Tax=Bradyrhizobium japonicum TaxID=375 RepID=UPI001E38D4B0|nr:hypothetical protein [Bradyrhizobium japonicum]
MGLPGISGQFEAAPGRFSFNRLDNRLTEIIETVPARLKRSDLVMMPSAWLTFSRRMFWFSKEAYKGRTINRFDTFEALSRFLIECVGKEKPS